MLGVAVMKPEDGDLKRFDRLERAPFPAPVVIMRAMKWVVVEMHRDVNDPILQGRLVDVH